uniref:Uncharacterized protein n=1 Tax=Anguilla anguilla TaxID=7936 RepID=A0A0E9XGD4_ANGAN
MIVSSLPSCPSIVVLYGILTPCLHSLADSGTIEGLNPSSLRSSRVRSIQPQSAAC